MTDRHRIKTTIAEWLVARAAKLSCIVDPAFDFFQWLTREI